MAEDGLVLFIYGSFAKAVEALMITVDLQKLGTESLRRQIFLEPSHVAHQHSCRRWFKMAIICRRETPKPSLTRLNGSTALASAALPLVVD
jgi:hypothetical protein